ncbi:MAG: alpha,2-mannosyltransferase [Alphaproteobacteria bacterium]|jgi:hypothetical protein|nr:alpha,2-mannosyltransferase [Alphaproteobacteria bacterium]
MEFATVAQRLIGNRAAVVACALAGMTIHLLLWQISEPADIFSDFFKAYYPAGEVIWRYGAAQPWSNDETGAVTFVNLPIFAWLFVPLSFLDKDAASWMFLALGIAAALAAWALLSRLARLDMQGRALLLLLFLISGPMVNSLREGNTTHFILLFLVVALLLWRAGCDYSAGLVLGACAAFKLPLLLFGAYFVMRGRWRVVAGGATMVALIGLLSLWYFGININIGWYHFCVEPFAFGVIPAFNVQSIDGFILRLTTGDALLWSWVPTQLPVASKAARTIVLAAMFGATFWLIWRADRKPPGPPVSGALKARDLLGFSLVLTLAFVTSPIAWTHYYLLLLLPFALHLGGCLGLPDDPVTRRLMWTGLALTSLPVVMPQLQPGWPAALIARTLVSLWLFGGLIMLAALARGAWHAGRARPLARTGPWLKPA